MKSFNRREALKLPYLLLFSYHKTKQTLLDGRFIFGLFPACVPFLLLIAQKHCRKMGK